MCCEECIGTKIVFKAKQIVFKKISENCHGSGEKFKNYYDAKIQLSFIYIFLF